MIKALSPAIFTVAFGLLSKPLLAAEHVLYEIPVEMNKNTEADRAMLVIVGDAVNIKEAEPLETYPLEKGQRADLLIFLDVGDDAVNVTDPPTIRKAQHHHVKWLWQYLQHHRNPNGGLSQ
jgi:hypothetical protein